MESKKGNAIKSSVWLCLAFPMSFQEDASLHFDVAFSISWFLTQLLSVALEWGAIVLRITFLLSAFHLYEAQTHILISSGL